MRNPESELVWQGRLQLGDEPGTFACLLMPGSRLSYR
ncbi:hypothetical protein BN1232_06167 [Mycobacterium lentiflavum]|uniref:Uncharacterized protein n=1 Tax=Mycobacterium lentiflavum TaxID=141349 RepID=A0A0E4H5R2_MYCLN|nr:hypothetical protein BN1232_06167 [Mycobacterium lentiflavum]